MSTDKPPQSTAAVTIKVTGYTENDGKKYDIKTKSSKHDSDNDFDNDAQDTTDNDHGFDKDMKDMADNEHNMDKRSNRKSKTKTKNQSLNYNNKKTKALRSKKQKQLLSSSDSDDNIDTFNTTKNRHSKSKKSDIKKKKKNSDEDSDEDTEDEGNKSGRRSPGHSISDDTIKQFAQFAGITIVTQEMYDHTRGVMETYLRNILERANIYVAASNRTTITKKDIINAFASLGVPIYNNSNEIYPDESDNDDDDDDDDEYNDNDDDESDDDNNDNNDDDDQFNSDGSNYEEEEYEESSSDEDCDMSIDEFNNLKNFKKKNQ